MEENKTRETVEDAAEKYAKVKSSSNIFRDAHIKDFLAGARWQSENMPVHILDVDGIHAYIKDGMVVIEKNDKNKVTYSEEEVFKLLNKLNNTLNLGVDTDLTLEVWFEQFKKK